MRFHRSSGRALVAAAAALACAFAPAAAAPAPSLDDALAAIAAYAPEAMAEQGTPGLALAITDRTHTLRTIVLGYADVAAKSPVTPQTRFAIGSITKSMTSLALMQLAGAGRLNLDAPVERYLPWFSIDANGAPILVHQILSHTAGVPDDYALDNGYVYDIAALRAAKVLFRPGTGWSYSNDGYATAGAILSTLDRRAWSASLQARVFDPIGMTDSSPVFTPEALATAATGYQWRDNDRPGSLHPVLTPSPAMDFVDPAGSVLSTPEDMARYMRLYLNGGNVDGRALVAAGPFARMTHADRLADGKPAGSAEGELAEWPDFYRAYGFGLSIFDTGGDRLIGHTGGVSGYTACMQMNLTRGFGAIAMANLVEAPLHPCAIVRYAMAVLRAQSAGEPLPAPPPPPNPRHVDDAAQYAGTYAAGGTSYVVAAEGDRLVLHDGSLAVALYPRGDDQFWADDPKFAQYVLAFGRDAHKRVVEMTYGSQWYPNPSYAGPRTFPYPPAWDALAGRYENVFWGQPYVTRVLIVKGRLTFDGTDALRPLPNGSFAIGSSIVRFDTYAAGHAQRMHVDGSALYRMELP